jgi:hypothetical protein
MMIPNMPKMIPTIAK